jgi:HK97 family phage portal protein
VGLLDRLRRPPTEERTLTRENVPATMLPYSRHALLDVSQSNVLRVADAYAAVQYLSNAVASLPPRVYRATLQGRVPVGDDQRLTALLRRPWPGATSSDLFSQIMVHLLTLGECFVGKWRSEGTITQLGLLHPSRLQVELRGQQIVYTLDGQTEHGVQDILHIRALTQDGLRGLSPVAQCRLALSLNANLAEFGKRYFEQGSRPAGIVKLPLGTSIEATKRFQEAWNNKHGGVEKMHRVALLEGDADWIPVSFSPDDSQFLQQRRTQHEGGLPDLRAAGLGLDAETQNSRTYQNVQQANRFLLDHSIRPWLVRIERAFNGDVDLLPGTAYRAFDTDALLRLDADARAQYYERALNNAWLTVDEVRAAEDLPPLSPASQGADTNE